MTTALIRLFIVLPHDVSMDFHLTNSTDAISRASVFYFELIPLLCLCGFKDGVFPGVCLLSLWRRSGLPVETAILFGPGLIPISSKNYKLIKLSPFYNGVEAPLSYIERLVETLHPNLVFCKQMHKALI